MADVLDVLGKALTPDALRALGPALGIDGDDISKLVKAIIPELVERLSNNAKGGDASKIAAAVTKDHDGTLLDIATSFLGGGFKTGPGFAILGHIFGDEFNGTVSKVAETTGLPDSVVKMGFNALAPLAMAAITKAALGAVTAVVLIKVLDVAVDGIRSGKVQRVVSDLNRRLDADQDGNAVDDVGRGAVGAIKKGGIAVFGFGKKVATNDKVQAGAAKTANGGKKLVVAGAKQAKKQAGKLFGRVFGRKG
jgi:Bacterial protein of unknown function (DUF937)